jgi:hypothetical protein
MPLCGDSSMAIPSPPSFFLEIREKKAIRVKREIKAIKAIRGSKEIAAKKEIPAIKGRRGSADSAEKKEIKVIAASAALLVSVG